MLTKEQYQTLRGIDFMSADELQRFAYARWEIVLCAEDALRILMEDAAPGEPE